VCSSDLSYQGQSWIATSAVAASPGGGNTPPPSSGSWSLLAARGSTGAQGFQGNQGNQGTQGFQGTQGAQGAQGVQGASTKGNSAFTASPVTLTPFQTNVTVRTITSSSDPVFATVVVNLTGDSGKDLFAECSWSGTGVTGNTGILTLYQASGVTQRGQLTMIASIDASSTATLRCSKNTAETVTATPGATTVIVVPNNSSGATIS